MKTFIIGILVLFTVFGCVQPAKEVEYNGNFVVEFLFEHDNCKIYRFKDGGRYIYWANCEGEISYNKVQSTGKSSTVKRIETIISKN